MIQPSTSANSHPDDLVLKPPHIPPSPIPDTIDELDDRLSVNDNKSIANTSTAIATPLTIPQSPSSSVRHQAFITSKDKLCFISYRGANTLRPRWYLVQIRLDSDEQSQANQYFVDFFRKHPTDGPKKDDKARFWPDWYEIIWADAEK